jgi:hypothetical protein
VGQSFDDLGTQREVNFECPGSLRHMALSEPTEEVAAFTDEVLRAGSTLYGIASDLIEDLPPDAFPGEEPAAVVIEALIGTIHTAVGDADPQDLVRASELLARACDRVLEHLGLTLELRQRMENTKEDGPTRLTAEEDRYSAAPPTGGWRAAGDRPTD